MNISEVGEGKVVLLSGGGKIFTDIAARFVGSERGIDDIIASDYDKKIVNNIVNSGHKAATEFDYFIFGVEGYSRVTEVQLVRKRLASYMIKSGRSNKNGKRSFDMVIPSNIRNAEVEVSLDSYDILIDDVKDSSIKNIKVKLNTNDLLNIIENWYNEGVKNGIPEEDLRYIKPQATEFKALIGMNAHSLLDWFQIRCCKNAQREIRDLAYKMLKLCKESASDLFIDAGASCISLGYCPENKRQHQDCKGKIYTKDEALKILKENKKK